MLAGPTTFEGIANSLKHAKDAAAISSGSGPPPGGQSSSQDAGPTKKVCTDERQPDGNLESALSRLGGMLESAGPLTDQACSQLDVPTGQLLVSLQRRPYNLAYFPVTQSNVSVCIVSFAGHADVQC